jgi:hypothetical protein
MVAAETPLLGRPGSLFPIRSIDQSVDIATDNNYPFRRQLQFGIPIRAATC